MADISSITLPDGSEYNIKDAGALRTDGTAVSAQSANRLEVTHNVTGSAGWKKFLELTATYASGIFVQLLIKDTFSAPCGIANIAISATANPLTTDHVFVEIMWLHPGAMDDIRFSIDGLTVTYYINKRGAGSGVYQFIVLSSTVRGGGYYSIPSTAWKNEAVTLSEDWRKSTGIRAQYDGNGNQIDTTYLPVTSTAARANRLAGLHTLTGEAGWYKIMDFTIETSTNSSRNFLLVVMDTYQTYTGIVKVNFRRTSATAIQCLAEWVAVNGQSMSAFAYTVDGSTGKCELYFRKWTSTTYDTKFQCIASTTLNTWIEATAIPWYTDGAAAPVSALPDNAVICYNGSAADRAQRLIPTKTFTGAAGWYKFFEVSLSSNQRYQFTFLIAESNTVRQGLLGCSLSRTSATAGSGWAGWLSAYAHITREVKYDYSLVNGVATLALYINKPDSATYGVTIHVLRSTQSSGAAISPYSYFIETPAIVTVPSTAKLAYMPTNAYWIKDVAVSVGTNQQLISISNTYITEKHVLSKIEFANPNYITDGYTWTTTDGAFTLTGTCTAATTANIMLTLASDELIT